MHIFMHIYKYIKTIYFYINNVILRDLKRLLIHLKSFNTIEFKVNNYFTLSSVLCQQL